MIFINFQSHYLTNLIDAAIKYKTTKTKHRINKIVCQSEF